MILTYKIKFWLRFDSYDQIKILNRKIRQNKAQDDLDRKAAKISALSSNNLDKYEYLTGKDLSLKPSTDEQAKFEYSPLDKMFNKGWVKLKFIEKIHNYEITLDEEIDNQEKLEKLIIRLENYGAKST